MKKILISIIGISIIGILIAVINLSRIRSEFITYLNREYLDIEFKVDMTKVDMLYGNYYTTVKSVDDNISFYIRKSFSDKKISDDYEYVKNLNRKNEEVKAIFNNTEAMKYIYSISGGSKLLNTDESTYTNIHIVLVIDTDAVNAIRTILRVLNEKNIITEEISFSFEYKDEVYEALYSNDIYNLTEKEIEDKIIRIK